MTQGREGGRGGERQREREGREEERDSGRDRGLLPLLRGQRGHGAQLAGHHYHVHQAEPEKVGHVTQERGRERKRGERGRETAGETEAYYLFFVASVGMALNLLVIITTFIRRNLRK